MKTLLTLIVAASAVSTPAFAGPYANVESNTGYQGTDYQGSTTDFHVGYEGDAGKLGWYVQGGPAVTNSDGGDSDTEFSGKGGVSFAATEKVNVYGEVSFATTNTDTNNYGTKVGVKYLF